MSVRLKVDRERKRKAILIIIKCKKRHLLCRPKPCEGDCDLRHWVSDMGRPGWQEYGTRAQYLCTMVSLARWGEPPMKKAAQ